MSDSTTSSLTGASQSNAYVTANGGSDAGGKIAWLFDEYSAQAAADPSGIDAAALQIAIWKTLYDGTTDLDTGTFTLVDNPAYGDYSAIKSQATADLDALYSNLTPGGPGYYTSETTFLDTAAGQDQVTGNPVPEPTSMLLLGSGLFAAFVRRRRPGPLAID